MPRRIASGHTTGVKREESDQVGTVPLIERNGLPRDKRRRSGKLLRWAGTRKGEKMGGQHNGQLILLRSGQTGLRKRLRCGGRRRLADAAWTGANAGCTTGLLPGHSDFASEGLSQHQHGAKDYGNGSSEHLAISSWVCLWLRLPRAS